MDGYASISELAEAEKIERGFLGKMLRLTLLAPDIVEGLMAGQHETNTLSLIEASGFVDRAEGCSGDRLGFALFS